MAAIESHPVRPFPKEHVMALHRRFVRNALAAALALAAHQAAAFEVTSGGAGAASVSAIRRVPPRAAGR